jgi:CheY-like chemotaxis protein
MRILFADDTQDTREMFHLALEMAGHSLCMVSDGIDAIAAARAERFDVIVLDVEMPEMNGWNAAREIRGLETGRDVPIIMFTAYRSPEDQRKAEDAGANFVLHKPVLPQELIFALDKVRQLI